jgi:hypothetical protein
MRTLNLEQMENVNGGQSAAYWGVFQTWVCAQVGGRSGSREFV